MRVSEGRRRAAVWALVVAGAVGCRATGDKGTDDSALDTASGGAEGGGAEGGGAEGGGEGSGDDTGGAPASETTPVRLNQLVTRLLLAEDVAADAGWTIPTGTSTGSTMGCCPVRPPCARPSTALSSTRTVRPRATASIPGRTPPGWCR